MERNAQPGLEGQPGDIGTDGADGRDANQKLALLAQELGALVAVLYTRGLITLEPSDTEEVETPENETD